MSGVEVRGWSGRVRGNECDEKQESRPRGPAGRVCARPVGESGVALVGTTLRSSGLQENEAV